MQHRAASKFPLLPRAAIGKLRIRPRELARLHFALDPFRIRDLGNTQVIGCLEVQPRTRVAAEESR
jgi:hypothetical protein